MRTHGTRGRMMTGLIDNAWTEEILPGAHLVRLERRRDDRGYITKLWQAGGGAPIVEEVYMTAVHPGIVKGWHKHRIMTLRLVCVSGAVMVGLVDERTDDTRIRRLFLSDGKPPYTYCYSGLMVPPGVWTGFRAVEHSESAAVILNLASHAHDDAEMDRVLPSTWEEKFDWGPYDRGVSK
jgi:dTDP-4-dehydrorhamnose 3,5-epimerase